MAFASKFYPKVEKKKKTDADKAGTSPDKSPDPKPTDPKATDPKDKPKDPAPATKPGDKPADPKDKPKDPATTAKPGDKPAASDPKKTSDKNDPSTNKGAQKDKKEDEERPAYVNNTIILFNQKTHQIKKESLQLKGDKRRFV